MTLSCYSVSLGCPKNRVDTERLLGSLGVSIEAVDSPDKAELVFINTCGFIAPAIQESVRVIAETIADVEACAKRPLLAVGGCLVGRYGAGTLAPELSEVDLWLDNADLPHWPAMLCTALGLPEAPQGRLCSTGPSYAWLKISDGCRHACAFCTIPQIRGALRSEPADRLEAEARALLRNGVRELVVVAQDVTAWGQDLAQGVTAKGQDLAQGVTAKGQDLAQDVTAWGQDLASQSNMHQHSPSDLRPLLDRLLPLPGLDRLRLLYLYPSGLTPELLRYLRDAGKPFVPYFDMPVQHAHADILSRMGRPFARDPRKVIDRIRDVFPEAVLRTSLIVGFPGETEAHFAALSRFVEDIRFNHLGVFAYQAEEGTPAATMPDQVPDAVKEYRRDAIMEQQGDISEQWLATFQGERLDILVDAPHPEWPGLHTGRAWFQAPEIDGITYISGPTVAPGAIVAADVVETRDYDLVCLEE